MKYLKFYPVVYLRANSLHLAITADEDLRPFPPNSVDYFTGWLENDKGEVLVENICWLLHVDKKYFKEELGEDYRKGYWKEVKSLLKRAIELGFIQE